ncbi:hypothetical protein HZA96_03785 [Candidatus Woesearchaeota archaeon]|nr:hypothetical protein [Candidatus Woesearchaeota archaeon]
MTDQRLTQYIKQLSQKGYDIQEIRGYLLKYYSQQEADAALWQFTKQERQRKFMKIFIILFAVIMVLFLIGLLIYKMIPNETLKEDKTKAAAIFTFSVKESIVQQGGILHYNLNSIPKLRKETITLEFKIADKQTNKAAASWKQIINKEDDFSGQQSYTIPPDFAVGNYKLVIKMSSGKDAQEYSKNVRVIMKSTEENCFDGIRNQDEQDVDCGGICAEKCEKESKIITEEIPAETKDNNEPVKTPQQTETKEPEEIQPKQSYIEIQKDYQLKSQAEKSAAASPQDAYNLCVQIISKTTAEDCLYEVAKISGSLTYCIDIQTEKERDSCYMYFATNNNEFACDEIVDAEYKNLCYGLLEIDAYKKKKQENLENGITEQIPINDFTVVYENKTDAAKTDIPSVYKQMPELKPEPKMEEKIIISNIALETIDAEKKISWKTNIASDSLVIYGYGEALDQQQYDEAVVVEHSVMISELSEGEYSFIINSSNEKLSAETEVGTFTFP